MKFSIQTKTLKEALAMIAAMPSPRQSLTSAQAVHIEADEFGFVYLRRVTQDASIHITLEADVDECGEIAVKFDSLNGIVSRSPHSSQQYTCDDRALFIQSGKSKVKLVRWPEGEKLKDFPEIDDFIEPLSLDSKRLKTMLSTGIKAQFKGAGRDELAGVCIRTVKDRLTIFGTDGRRFHGIFDEDRETPILLSRNERGEATSFDRGVLLSSQLVACIERCIEGEPTTGLKFSENVGQIETTSIRLKFLIPECFPPDISIFLEKGEIGNAFTLNAGELYGVIKAGVPLALGDTQTIGLHFEKDSVRITAHDADGSEYSDAIEATAKQPQKISVNASYMLDLLGACDEDNIELEFLPKYQTLRYTGTDRTLVLATIRTA